MSEAQVRKKRTVVIRRKVNAKTPTRAQVRDLPAVKISGSEKKGSRKVIVARRMRPGDSINVGNQTLTMPGLSTFKNSQREAKNSTIVTVPQSVALARSSYLKPLTAQSESRLETSQNPPLTSVKRDSRNQIVGHSILGNVDDFDAIDRIQNPEAYSNESSSQPQDRGLTLDTVAAGGVPTETVSPWMQLQKAKKQEKLRNKKLLKNMLFAERLLETHDQRSAKLWEKRKAEWKSIQKRLSKKLNVHPEDLSFSSGEAYNQKVQEHAILHKEKLLHEQFGKFHWLMSLRGFNSNYVRVGHEFAGLFCRVREPVHLNHELIVKPQATTEDTGDMASRVGTRDWRNESNMAQRRTKAEPKVKPSHHPHANAKKNIDEMRNNALVIEGTPLFEDIVTKGGVQEEFDPTQIEEGTQLAATEGGVNSREISEEALSPAAPRVELSTSRIVFECFHGQSSTSSVFFHNSGSTALFYHWHFQDGLAVSLPESDSAASKQGGAGSENIMDMDHNFEAEPVLRTRSFYSTQTKGMLNPGEWGSLTVTFTPTKSGAALEVLRMVTEPVLDTPQQVVLLKGICLKPDRLKLKRVAIASLLKRDATRHGVEDLLRRTVRSIQPSDPEPEELPKLFYVINRKHGLKLWFYEDNFADFQRLARDTLDVHKRSVRENVRWDYSAHTLKEWITNVPKRHEQHIPQLTERWEKLVAVAAVRPQPTPLLYKVMSSLVTDAVKHVPRVGRAYRTALEITEPIVNPHPEDDDKEGNKKHKHHRVSRAPVVLASTPEERAALEEERQRNEEIKKLEIEEYKNKLVEREELEGQYKMYIRDSIKNMLKTSIKRFELYTQNEQARDGYLAQAEQHNSTPYYRLLHWGNTTLQPHLASSQGLGHGIGTGIHAHAGHGRSTARESQHARRNKKQEEEEERIRKENNKHVLCQKGVTLAGASSSRAFAVTKDNFVYTWPVFETKVDKTKGKNNTSSGANAKGAKPPKASAGGKNKKDSKKGVEVVKAADLKEEMRVEELPCYAKPTPIPELQGFDFVQISCGATATAFVTDDHQLVVWPQTALHALDVEDDRKSTIPNFGGHGGSREQDSSGRVTPGSRSAREDLASRGTNAGDEGQESNEGRDLDTILTPRNSHPSRPGARHLTQKLVIWNDTQDVAVGKSNDVLFLVLADTKGRTYTWGENTKQGLLGHGDKKPLSIPTQLPALKGVRVTQVAAGSAHILALTDQGAVWAWGHGEFGVLGVGDKKARNVPTRVAGFIDLSAPPLERQASNSRAPSRTSQNNPVKKRRPSNGDVQTGPEGEAVVSITCGHYHSVAVTSAGHVYTWGKGSSGQLGHGDTKDCETPKMLAGELEGLCVTSIAAGSAHTVALVGATGHVYTWGQNSTGALGLGHDEDVCVPTQVMSFVDQEALWKEATQKQREKEMQLRGNLSHSNSELSLQGGAETEGKSSTGDSAESSRVEVRTKAVVAGGPWTFAMQNRVAPGENFEVQQLPNIKPATLI